MTSRLSDWAREFLREDRVAVVSTLNKDGSPQVTTIWYLLQEDGTLVMSTPGRTQKVKNLCHLSVKKYRFPDNLPCCPSVFSQ